MVVLPIDGVTDAPATGGDDGAPSPTAAPVDIVPDSGISSPLPATNPEPDRTQPAAPATQAPGAEAPTTLPFTGAALSGLFVLGLLLMLVGCAASVAGRRQPAHAVPGFWSR